MFDLPWLWFTATLVLIGVGFAFLVASWRYHVYRYDVPGEGEVIDRSRPAVRFLERLCEISLVLAVVTAIFAAIAFVKTGQSHILILIVLITVGLAVAIYLIVALGRVLRKLWDKVKRGVKRIEVIVSDFRRGPDRS